jgi:hypothetical protein
MSLITINKTLLFFVYFFTFSPKKKETEAKESKEKATLQPKRL